MAKRNWGGFGSGDGINERPMMNLGQTEGEGLHEQALSFFAHGSLAQAKLMLEKAILLEPSNDSFQETRNYFSQVNQWSSPYAQHQQGAGNSFPDAEPQWSQFGSNPGNPVNSSRPSWDDGGLHSRSNISNGNVYKPKSEQVPWQQPANENSTQYFSDTVADSMFSPAYWSHADGVQNHRVRSHFGDPQPPQRQNNDSCASRTNFGSHYEKASNAYMCNISTQDNVWGQWNVPEADSDPKPETSWADSGYKQSDVLWTDEPRRAASLPNCTKSGANGSVSQSSLRGSMANSAERFTLKEQRDRAGRSSPHTERSEETRSETKSETTYGLDNFDEVSNKVQEWLVRNESSAVQNPPHGLSKPKKSKKKKKKKMEVIPKHESQETAQQSKNDASQSERGQTFPMKEPLLTGGSQNPVGSKPAIVESGCQKDDTKSSSVNAPYHNQSSKPRTVPSTANSATNSNSDKLSKHSIPNPNGSKSCTESESFFDPKRIFDGSNLYKASKPSCSSNQMDSAGDANSRRRTEMEDTVSYKNLSSNESKGEGHSATRTEAKQRVVTRPKITDEVDCNSSQNIEADNMTEDINRSRLDSSGSVNSDVSGRMTREEWEEIIKRMYVPLGIPSNIRQENSDTAYGSSSEETKATAKQPVQNCSENLATASDSRTFKGCPISELETVCNSGISSLRKEPNTGSTKAAEKYSRSPQRVEYVDVKASLDAGLLATSIPVCHAGTGIRSTAPADKRIRFFGKDKCLSTESTRPTQSIPSSQKAVSKGPSVTPKRAETSPEVHNNLSSKPVQKPKVDTSAAPSEKMSNVASNEIHVTSSKGTSKGSTKPVKDAKVVGSVTPKRAETSPEVHNNLSSKPVQKPKVDTSAAPSEKMSNVASSEIHVTSSKGTSKGSTKPVEDAKVIGKHLLTKHVQETNVKTSAASSEKSSNGSSRGLYVTSAKGACKNLTKPVQDPTTCVKDPKIVGKNLPTKPVKEPKVEAITGLHATSSNATSKGSTKPVKEPKVEVSSAASSNAAGGVEVEAKHPGASNKKCEQEAPAKVQPTQPSKAFWEPTRIFAAAPKKDQTGRKKQSSAGETCAETTNLKNMKRSESDDALKAHYINPTSNRGLANQPVTETKMTTSVEIASFSNSDCKSPTLKSSDSLNSANISQTNVAPLKSSSKYSYTAWRDQKAEKEKNTSKKTSQTSQTQASQNKSFASTESKRSGQTESQSAPKPAARPPKVSTSQNKSEGPGLRSESASTKVPAKETSENTQFSSSGKRPQPAPAAASTPPQDHSNSRNAPANNSPREDFSKSRTNSSQKVPSSKPDVKSKESSKSHPGESKTRSASAPNSHQHQQRRAETSTTNASHPGRPSTDSNYQSSRSGAAQESRQQTSSKTSGARPAANAREKNTDPQQRQRAGTTPDNLDVEDVDPWYKWTRAIGRGLWWTLCFVVFLLLILVACLLSTLKIGLKYSWHILRELVKMIQEYRNGKRSHEGSSEGQGSWRSPGTSNNRVTAEPTRSIDIPTSGGQAIKRLMRCNQDNPYEVLGVSSEASEDDIKKYYRRQCMLVHPDKNDLPNAQEAFQILQKAYEILTDPVKRRNFEMESKYTHFNEEMEDFVKKMEEKMEDVLNSLPCEVCHGKHRRYETDRDPDYARYCRRHGTRHSAYEGDVWVETTHLGFKWHFYAMMEDKVFDITDWAKCQDMKYMEANSCEVRYRVGTKRNRNPSRPRTASPNQHPHHHHQRGQDFNGDVMTEEMLKEFLRQFQQGDPRGGGAGGAGYGGGDSGGQDRGKKHKKHRKKKR